MKPERFCCLLCLSVLLQNVVAGEQTEWTYAGKAVLSRDTEIGGFRVGGLSGIAQDPRTGLLWAVSDARRWPETKIFQFSLQAPSSEESALRIAPHGVLGLRLSSEKQEPLDAEGIAFWNWNRLFVSHEGSKSGSLPPGIACFNQKSGKFLFQLPVPPHFAPDEEGGTGIRSNRGFESLAVRPGRPALLYTVTESPLLQDLPAVNPDAVGPLRILRYDLSRREALPQEKVYLPEADGVYGSVTELLSEEDGGLLVLERQMLRVTPPRERRFRIFRVNFEQPNATEVSALPALQKAKFTALKKELVFDSMRQGMREVDNVEGMTWVNLPDGRRGILLVSDDNFSRAQQTEFYLLKPSH